MLSHDKFMMIMFKFALKEHKLMDFCWMLPNAKRGHKNHSTESILSTQRMQCNAMHASYLVEHFNVII